MNRSLFTICLLSTSLANADENADSIYDLTLKELMKVSVITAASDFEQSRDQVFASHTVITKQEWQAFGANRLSEALTMVAGMHVGKSVLAPSHNHYSIRGLGGHFGEQIRLMVDGKPLDRKYNGGRPFGFNLPLGGFKRIEVVRGPGSAVYGADAYAGVINLVSNTFEDNQKAVTFGSGNFGFNHLSMQQTFGDQSHNLLFSIDYMNYDDDPARIVSRDLQSDFDDIFATEASNAPGPIDEHFQVMTLNAKWQWQNIAVDYFSWRNFDTGLVAGAALALDNKGHIRSKFDMLDFDWAIGESFGWEPVHLSMGYHTVNSLTKYYLFPAGTRLPIGSDGNMDFVNPTTMTLFPDGIIGAPDTYGKNLNVKLTQVLTLDDHKVRWQIGYQKDSIRTRERKNFGPGVLQGNETVVDGVLTDVTGTEHIFMPDKTSHFYFISFMDQWQLNKDWLLNIGARYDRYSNFGSTTNPRFGLIYQVRPETKLKVFAGSAFRAPTYSELYVSNNPVTIGNEALQPENVRTLESGLGLEHFIGDNFIFSASIFRYHADNLINFEFEPELQLNLAQNTGEQKGRGFEVSIRHKPREDMTIQLNYSHLNGEDKDNSDIPNYPNKLLNGGFNWRISDRWNWSFDGRWVTDRQREVGDLRPEIDDYLWFNTTLSANEVVSNFDITVAVKNLFDVGAKEPASNTIPDDFPLHGRFYSVNFSYRF